jgi:hypothetical protein
VRCKHYFILVGPASSRVRTLVLKTFDVFRNSNSRTLEKGRVRTSLEFSQATVEQDANFPHPNSEAGYELHWHSHRLQWNKVRTSQASSQATHMQGANFPQATLRWGANLPGKRDCRS